VEFHELNLPEPLLRAVKTEGYLRPTPIQEQAIPVVLQGRDVLGCAQTGTGKTAAFALPILARLMTGPARGHGHHVIRCLVVTPTRELAAQISDSFTAYGRHSGLHHTVVFGGVGQDGQTRALHAGVDILVATPGRLLDLMNQGIVKLRGIEIFVLDEADRMLDMGFIPDVRRIVASLPQRRQTLLFSATLGREIEHLAASMVNQPVRVSVAPSATTVETVEQRVYFVERASKRDLLLHLLETDPSITRALVFTRTKHGADKVSNHLHRAGQDIQVIHGNKGQNARTRALDRFKTGHSRVLVATDIAARGIDVESISHVVNFDMPETADSYVHRIGRTARAGAAGIAISFCGLDERPYLKSIEKIIRHELRVIEGHPFPSMLPPPKSGPVEPSGGSPRSKSLLGARRKVRTRRFI
jgi:ATP-dependent RNA helicase RhlE